MTREFRYEEEDIPREYTRLNGSLFDIIDTAIRLGEDKHRLELFKIFRDLIREKDLAGDAIAVEVLSWAYEKLAQE